VSVSVHLIVQCVWVRNVVWVVMERPELECLEGWREQCDSATELGSARVYVEMCTRNGYMGFMGEGRQWEIALRCQWSGLWGWKVDRGGSGLCPVSGINTSLPEHSECHVVSHGKWLF
jgi:hypothetical protein